MAMPIFSCEHRVTYADCTVGNHIYYGRYLPLLELARGACFRDLGLSFLQLQQQDTVFPVTECRLKYLFPAGYDDLLKIQTRISFARGVRLNFAHEILNQAGCRILEAETFHACANVAGKPKRIPEAILAILQPVAG